MITVEQHLNRILGTVRRLPGIDIGLLDAHGCVLAADVASDVDLPGFTNSAMDGYVVRAADVAGATEDAPAHLPVVGDIAAGNTKALSLAPGQSMRIMTGAPVPHGADAVVMVEATDGGLAKVAIRQEVVPGQHVRDVGEDVRAGDVVLRRRHAARCPARSACSPRSGWPGCTWCPSPASWCSPPATS